MANSEKQVLLGTRVPSRLKHYLSQYCSNHGIKISYFVAQAIKERLLSLSEDNEDLKIARQRLKAAEFASQKELDAYLRKRKIAD